MSGDLTLLEMVRRFPTEDAARSYFERVRWPNGPICPHCGNADKNYALTPNKKARIREGLFKCGTCDNRFSVTVGTVMESSHIPLNKWLIAFYVICASKSQVSALQLQRQLEIGSYRTALFLCHRVRFALNRHPEQAHTCSDATDCLPSGLEKDPQPTTLPRKTTNTYPPYTAELDLKHKSLELVASKPTTHGIQRMDKNLMYFRKASA